MRVHLVTRDILVVTDGWICSRLHEHQGDDGKLTVPASEASLRVLGETLLELSFSLPWRPWVSRQLETCGQSPGYELCEPIGWSSLARSVPLGGAELLIIDLQRVRDSRVLVIGEACMCVCGQPHVAPRPFVAAVDAHLLRALGEAALELSSAAVPQQGQPSVVVPCPLGLRPALAA